MKLDIIRAWKDDAYYTSLSDEGRALLPANPVGELELSDADLALVYGGTNTNDSNNGDCPSIAGWVCTTTNSDDNCEVKGC